MKSFKIKVVGLSLLLALRSLANLPEDPGEYERWESKLLASIREQEHVPPDVSIPKLGRWVMQMSLPNNLEKGDRPVFRAAQAALLAIPGHATYYGERISKAQVERKAAIADADDGGIGTANYSIKSGEFRNEETDGLQVLRHLPSPETIKVLGDFLSDEWVSPRPVQDNWLWQSLARHSVEMLAIMPIVKKPEALTEDPSNPGKPIPDLKAWQQWYEQIKAGKRTFRFEGDPTEYTLTGPATQEMLQRIERDRRRDEERLNGHKRTSGSTAGSVVASLSRPSTLAALLVGFAMCAAAVWYFLKSRRTA